MGNPRHKVRHSEKLCFEVKTFRIRRKLVLQLGVTEKLYRLHKRRWCVDDRAFDVPISTRQLHVHQISFIIIGMRFNLRL